MNKQQKDKKMKNKQPTATFCITGALEKYKRVDAIVEIHNKTNARFVSGVSSKTDYLISCFYILLFTNRFIGLICIQGPRPTCQTNSQTSS